MERSYTTAAELKRVLDELRSANSAKRSTVGAALCKIFGLDADEKINEIFAFGKLMTLCNRLNSEVLELELEVHHIERIVKDTNGITAKIIGAGPFFEMGNWVDSFSESHIAPLTYVDMALAGRITYPDLQDEAAQIEGSLSKSISEILDSNIPKDLKTGLVKKLTEALTAIQNIRVWGPDGVKDSVLLLSGEMTLAAHTAPDIKQKNFWKEMVSSVNNAFEMTRKMRHFHGDASYMVSAAEPFSKLLQ